MKKLIITVLMGITSVVSAELPTDVVTDIASSAVGGAVSSTFSDLKVPTKPTLDDEPITKPAFFYVQFAVAESDLTKMGSVLPGLGIGYRRLAGNGAADISFRGIGYAERNKNRIFWTMPKVSYLHYLQPDQNRSLYLGGGLAWGGVAAKSQSFVGIIPSLTAGYEFVRKSTVLGFTEFNLSQPAIEVSRKGSFPGPVAEWTVGIGF